MTRPLCLLLLAFALASCAGDRVVTCLRNQIYEDGRCRTCPQGQVADPATHSCVPEASGADALGDLALPDLVQDNAPGDIPAPDLEDLGTPEAPTELPDLGPDANPSDAAPDLVPASPSGGPCALDAHCPDGEACLDWPQGYCARLGCQADEDCPEDAHCIPLLDNGAACFVACGDRPCREGYACKQVPYGLSGLAQICHPEGDGQLFSPCGTHGDCQGALSCLPSGAGLRCLLLGCPGVPCPQGSSCMELGAMPLCLADCDDAQTCPEGFQTCRKLPLVGGGTRSVCGPALGGLALGEPCGADLDCASAFCLAHQRGACSDSGAPCFDDLGCKASVCLYSAALFEGVCAQVCGPEQLCSEGLCVGGPGGSALCVPLCNDGACPSAAQACIFGDTLYPPSPGGRFGCLHRRPGSPGSPCKVASDCADKAPCILGAGALGYCSPGCDPWFPECPFGTACLKPTGDVQRCVPRCKTNSDCPQGFSCQTPVWAGTGVCV